MDAYEATDTVMSRIRSIDPENASRISGYVLMNVDEKELIRLAFGPEALLLSYINQAKAYLSGLGSSKSLNPNPVRPFHETSPRILIPNDGFHLSSPSPPPAAASPRPSSYAAVLNGGKNVNGVNNSFYGGSELFSGGSSLHHQNQDQSPSGRSDSLFFDDANTIPSPHPHSHSNPFHRRSYSVNDAAGVFEDGDDGGVFGGRFGCSRPCMYFARGFCKNGSSCKFIHSDMSGDISGGETIELGSPSSGFDELLRIKALQQQRVALMASGGHHPFSYNQRNIDFSPIGMVAGANSSARQIYLTFPADSTFKEEDVSSYFSTFGPVQDVRIPYQQKRMFGFVTFVYPETVKLILAKGNPHFVCDSRVLVKPYKEKGKIPDKKQLQQHLSPSRIDSREVFSVPIGPRMLLNNTQEILLRRKLEQEAEIQHAIERRMMNLQLMDIKNLQHNNHRFLSPRQASLLMSQNLNASSDAINLENFQDFDTGQETSTNNTTLSGNNNHQHVNDNDSYTPESLGLILPDSLFASPTKLAAENRSIFCQSSAEADNSIIPVTSTSSNNPLNSSSPLSLASHSYSENTSH